MPVYFKSITASGLGELSHYYLAPPFPHDWQLVPTGGLLPVTCNDFGLASLSNLASGSHILLIQRVLGVPRIVTHWVETTGVGVVQHGHLPGFPFMRQCRIIKQLDPRVLQARLGPAQLEADVLPDNLVTLDALFPGNALAANFPQNGRVMGSAHGQQIGLAQVQAALVAANGFI